MALGNGDNGTDWSVYGPCESCGSVPGWPCHRGQRQLKNAHKGRPETGAEPYVTDSGGAMHAPARDVSAGQSLPAGEEGTVANDPAAEAADWTARLDNAERQPQNPTGKRRSDAEVPKDVDRDQYDRPKLVRAVQDSTGAWVVPMVQGGDRDGAPILELEGFTRASTLGNALEDSTGLNRWRTGMVVFGMSRRRDLVLAAQAIPGTEDKKRHRQPLYQVADAALEAAEASSAATVGTALHALTEQADAGTLTVDIGEYQSVLDVYLERMAGWRVVRSETFVVSDYFHAAGTFDRLITPEEPMALVDPMTGEIVAVIMPGDLIVVDLKTSTTADYFGAKFFAQLAVYVTGSLYDRDRESPTFGQRTPLGARQDFALILHIPQGGDADGEPSAEWHWLDMRAGLALAQLACVVLETRKKRFTRTHMHRVIAQPYTPSGDVIAPTRAPLGLPARDPLGSEHLRVTSQWIEEAESFPDDQADAVDAELVADGAMPETRVPPPAALAADNLGRLAEHALDRSAGDPGLANPEGPERALETERGPEPASRDQPESAADFDQEEPMPGPEETAPLPDGWESKAEQEQAQEDRMSVPKVDPDNLGPSLQAAAKLRAQETALIGRIGNAENVAALVELHQKATAHGLWTDRVKAAASARKATLKARTA